MREKKCRRSHYTICFCISFALRLLWFICQNKLICIQDELGFLIVPATLAGNDWSGSVDQISYYGFGYSILITPVYLITRNPYVIYWSMMILGALVLALCSCMVCFLSAEYLGIDPVTSVIMAITMAYLAVPEMRYLNNEPMITFVVWGIALLLVMLFHEPDGKRKNLLSVLLMVLALYALTVHNRLVIMEIFLCFAIVMCFILYRKKLIPIPALAGAAVFVAVIEKLIIPYMEKKYWQTGSREFVANTVATASGGLLGAISRLMDINFLDVVIRILAGNMFTSALHSCGVFIIALLMFLHLPARIFGKKADDLPEGISKSLTLIDLFIWPTFLGTLAGIALMWGSGVLDGIWQGYGVYAYAYKAFYYLRYYAPYLSVVIYTALVRLCHNRREILNTEKMRYAILLILFGEVFMKLITPYLIGTLNGLYAFGSYGFYKEGQTVTEPGLYLLVCVLVMILAFVTVKLIGMNKPKGMIILTLLIFLVNYHGGFYVSAVISESYEDMGHTGYKVFRYLETLESFEKEIYVVSSSRHSFTAYQMLLSDYRIIDAEEFPTDEEKCFVVTNRINERIAKEAEDKEYSLYTLDDNEYLWIKGYDFGDEVRGLAGE